MSAAAPRGDHVARGIALIVLSTFLTASQDAIFKYSVASVTLWQVYVLRSLFLIPVLLLIGYFWGGVAVWRQAFRTWPLVRAGFFVLMYFSMYTAIPLVSLSTIAGGLYTAPLFVAALSAPLLGERVGWRGWLAILIGFVGVLAILRPGSDAFTWVALLPVLGGFCYALSVFATRGRLRDTPPPALAIALGSMLLIIGVVGSVVFQFWGPSAKTVAISPFLFGPWGAVDPATWAAVAVLAALMCANGLVLPAAYQSAPSVIIATFDYCYLIFATAFGFMVFHDVPDLQTVVGIFMIAGAGLMISRR